MANYKFNYTGLKLYDLLTFALAVEPEARQWFIRNLGEDILSYYYNKTHKNLEDDLYWNISHSDYYGEKSYDVLRNLLMGKTRMNQYGNTIGDTAAGEDMRKILEILDNPNDIDGQNFLFRLLNEWEKLPETDRSGFNERFANICRTFLLEPNNTFRINDSDMKKSLMFRIADNVKWYDKFRWYAEILDHKDINLNASEMRSLYDKMLGCKNDFVQHYKQQELERKDGDPNGVERWANEKLAKVEERLEQVLEKEATRVKKRYETPTVTVREKTREELLEEIISLRKQNMLLRQALDVAQKSEVETPNKGFVYPDRNYNM